MLITYQNENRVIESELILKFSLINQNNEYHHITKKTKIIKNNTIAVMILTKLINNKSIQSSVTFILNCTEKHCCCKHSVMIDAEDVNDHQKEKKNIIKN